MRNRYFLFSDIVLILLSSALSFGLRFDFYLTSTFQRDGILLLWVISIPVYMCTFLILGIYARYWPSAGPNELILLAAANLMAGFICVFVVLVIALPSDANPVPRTIPIINAFILLLGTGAARFSLRAYRQLFYSSRKHNSTENVSLKRVLIIGAGESGIHVLQSLTHSNLPVDISGFLDDDPERVGVLVRGVRVIGYFSDLEQIIFERRINLVVIATPSASGKQVRDFVSVCQKTKVEYKIIPNAHEITSGKFTINRLRSVAIEDLLRRSPVALDTTNIRRQIEGACVLITGAGGSIGSELSRQIARFKPRTLILLGHGENSLFAIENRLKKEYPDVAFKLILADVRDIRQLEKVFIEHQPSIVFHAAAHKHVPMVEGNAAEGVLNNVLGTRNLIELCNKFEVERMVHISTDKAVEPTSVMGMSKRVAEILILDATRKTPARFASVRFGNVLGSRGSVIPLFQDQINWGGPITITSKTITRYFMSIPEAVSLVMRASVFTGHGPLFVLNMGTPIRIYDLASDLIRLNGLQPDVDIEIHEIGLRPGEKLYEDLSWKYESKTPIDGGALFSIGIPAELACGMIDTASRKLEELLNTARSYDNERTRQLLHEIVYFTPELQLLPEGEKLGGTQELVTALPFAMLNQSLSGSS